MKNIGILTAGVLSLMFAVAPLSAQENNQSLSPQPAKGEDQTPGLQQTPDGQTMKTAGEKTKTPHEAEAGAASGGTTSTGPTFPNAPPAK